MVAKAAKSKASKDAIQLLKSDHRTVEALFEDYENAHTKSTKARLARDLCMELVIHTMIEEEIFYPGVRGEVEEGDLDEAYVEHDGAKILIAELMAGSPRDDFYDAKVNVLSEDIKHHIKEEEGREGLFAQASKAGVDLDALGQALAERKAELKAAFKRNGIPTPETRTMAGAKVKVGARAR